MWYACQAQAFIVALAPCKVNRIVGRRAGSETLDREVWIERKSALYRCPRRAKFTKKRQLSSEMKVRGRKIAIELKSAAHPRDGFGAGIELRLAETGPQH